MSLPGVVQEYTVRTMDDSHEDDEEESTIAPSSKGMRGCAAVTRIINYR